MLCNVMQCYGLCRVIYKPFNSILMRFCATCVLTNMNQIHFWNIYHGLLRFSALKKQANVQPLHTLCNIVNHSVTTASHTLLMWSLWHLCLRYCIVYQARPSLTLQTGEGEIRSRTDYSNRVSSSLRLLHLAACIHRVHTCGWHCCIPNDHSLL